MTRLDRMIYKERLERIFYKVTRPSAYINGELECILPSDVDERFKVAISYPDLYEIGQSNLGVNIVYSLINSIDGMFCDRVYNVREDMSVELKNADMQLATIAANIPLSELDVLAITLQSELTYTNILSLLELGGIPLRSEDRKDEHPIVIAGGPLAFAPEPLAPFIDVFFIGDAEAWMGGNSDSDDVDGPSAQTDRSETGSRKLQLILASILNKIKSGREKGDRRDDILKDLLATPELYIPRAYIGQKVEDTVVPVPSWNGAEFPIKRAILKDLNEQAAKYGPNIIPFSETMHDRLSIEVMRGCTRGCRFCFAGMIYRPYREKDRSHILSEIASGLLSSGYDEYSLASLSTSDHSDIAGSLRDSMDKWGKHKIAAALPSLRLDSFDLSLARDVLKVKRTGLTFAPEAGSRRLRRVINKHLEEEELENTIRQVFEAGWQRVKLYFMVGLPGETEEDVRSIGTMAKSFMNIAHAVLPKGARGRAKIVVNVGMFVPKPFTPFQWAPMIHPDEASNKIRLIKEEVSSVRAIEVKYQDVWMSFIEGLVSRGDRISAELVMKAYKKGACFDQWSEHFNKAAWLDAAEELKVETGLDVIERAVKGPAAEALLPWDHIDAGIDREFLLEEWESSKDACETGDCRSEQCTLCGVCMSYGVQNISAQKEVLS